MNNLIGDDAQSAQDEEDREGELLCLKIKAQLEDLFSDSHLAEDGFLLKHVQKSRLGYVSLKLLTCLKKIRVLTKNWYMTLAAAEYSEVLEVNDECTKVRRIAPLPKWLLCSPTNKLLLAWNISAERTKEDGTGDLEPPSLSQRILQKFGAYGHITSVWILHPGKELPKELQCYAKCHKELGQHLCAVVKFDTLEVVRKAYSALKSEEKKSKGESICVIPLGFQSMQHITEDKPSEDQPGKSAENPLETSEDLIQEEPSLLVEDSDGTPDTSQPRESLDNSIQKTSEQISTYCYVQSVFGLNQRYIRIRRGSGDSNKGHCQSPWVCRRIFAASALKVAGHSSLPCSMQRVLRQPLGPDGTKGFRDRWSLLQRSTLPCMV